MLGLPSISNIILGVYGIIFSTLVFVTETQIFLFRKLIAVNFGFLFHPILRLLFYGVLCSVAISYESLLGYVSAGLVAACAAYNTYVLWVYPEYKEERDRLAREEDQVVESRLREEGLKQVNGGMGEGGDL